MWKAIVKFSIISLKYELLSVIMSERLSQTLEIVDPFSKEQISICGNL